MTPKPLMALVAGAVLAACNPPIETPPDGAATFDLDAAQPGPDASQQPADASVAPVDARVPEPDASAPVADAGADAGILPDATAGEALVKLSVQWTNSCAVDPPLSPGLATATPTAARVGIVGLELLKSRDDQTPVTVKLAAPLVEVAFPQGGVVAQGSVAPGTYRFLRYSLWYAAVTVPATAHQGPMVVPGSLEFDIATASYTATDGHLRPAGELVARFSAGGSTFSQTATAPLDCPLSEAGGVVETNNGAHRITVPVPGGPLVVAAGGSAELTATFPVANAVTWLDLASPNFTGGVMDILGTPTGSETPARLPICDLLLSDRCEPGAAPNRSFPAWPIPDSSTTTCTDGTGVTSCPTSGGTGYGQDGNYSINPAKLTVDGEVVHDEVTGLTWQRHAPAQSYDWWAAREYCASLDLGGQKDWSLPSRIELASLLDAGRSNPSIDLVAFAGEPAEFFWSNSPALFSSLAFGIRFDQGFVYDHDPKVSGRVRCVRLGRQGPSPRMVIEADTAKDSVTGLTWQRGWQTAAPWLEAIATCEKLTLAGADDWRLPTIKELLSIVEDRAISPSTDVGAFPGNPAEWMWTNTPGLTPPNYAWTVSFTDGFSTPAAVTQLYIFRCVRGP